MWRHTVWHTGTAVSEEPSSSITPWTCTHQIHPPRRYIPTRQYGVTSQKTATLTQTAVITSISLGIKTPQTCILSFHLRTKADVYCRDGKCNMVMEYAASLQQQNHARSGGYTEFHPRSVQCSPFSNGYKQKFVCTNSLGHRVLLRPVGTS